MLHRLKYGAPLNIAGLKISPSGWVNPSNEVRKCQVSKFDILD
jgi:hypothetical protein